MKYLNRKTLAELCNEAGITCTTYYYRRRKGKTHEEALESKKPIRTVEDIARQQRRRQRLRQQVRIVPYSTIVYRSQYRQ